MLALSQIGTGFASYHAMNKYKQGHLQHSRINTRRENGIHRIAKYSVYRQTTQNKMLQVKIKQLMSNSCSSGML